MRVLSGGVVVGLAPEIRLPHSLAQTTEPSTVPAIPPGPFQGTRESLQTYKVPDWYSDAKFGIWAHWTPLSAAEYGDCYARRMYVEGEPLYEYHIKTYGRPSKFGFKDAIATWKIRIRNIVQQHA